MALPDFFVVGAPRAGSTALHETLATHPRLYLSTPKEPGYFLADGAEPPRPTGPGDAYRAREDVWRRDAYEALFARAPAGALRGESTPYYLSETPALERIRAAVPDARLIAILRDPVDRAYSHWAELRADGLEPEPDFLRACTLEDERRARGWSRAWGYKRLGSYGEQVTDLLGIFPRDQVLLLRYRDLVDAPRVTLDAITAFLGVETGRLDSVIDANLSTYVPPSRRTRAYHQAIRAGAAVGAHLPPQLWRTASAPIRGRLRGPRRDRPPLPPEQRRRLVDYFADDLRRLEHVTGATYAEWRSDASRGTYPQRAGRS